MGGERVGGCDWTPTHAQAGESRVQERRRVEPATLTATPSRSKPLPRMVISVPPAREPLVGDTEEMRAACAEAARHSPTATNRPRISGG